MPTRITRKQLDELFGEIERYLTAVDAFRDEGREPRWRSEVGATRGRVAKGSEPAARKRRGHKTRKHSGA
jgi:hypothetical protein